MSDTVEQARVAVQTVGLHISALKSEIQQLTADRDNWKSRYTDAIEKIEQLITALKPQV